VVVIDSVSNDEELSVPVLEELMGSDDQSHQENEQEQAEAQENEQEQAEAQENEQEQAEAVEALEPSKFAKHKFFVKPASQLKYGLITDMEQIKCIIPEKMVNILIFKNRI
jgi:FKBP-type peptidyl-prolyl cis-trans isomerase